MFGGILKTTTTKKKGQNDKIKMTFLYLTPLNSCTVHIQQALQVKSIQSGSQQHAILEVLDLEQQTG